MSIKSELSKLKTADTYSLLLFALYKFADIPEYSSLSELIYVLDKPNFLKLCEMFGGTTIKIPTIANIKMLSQALLLYQYIDIDGMDYKQAIELIDCASDERRQIKAAYAKLVKILNNYSFEPREE